MRRKMICALLSTTMVAMLLAGCGGSSNEPAAPAEEATEAPAEAEPEEAAEEAPAEEATPAEAVAGALDSLDVMGLSEGDWMIGFSNYSVGNSWRQQMEAEFETEAEKLKEAGIISDYVMLNADNDQAKQISDINDLVTMGCDAIIVTAITADGLNDVLEEAEEEGVIVVNFDNGCSTENITSKIKVSDYDFGFSAGEWLGTQLESGAKLIQLDGTAGTDTNTNRSKGMLEGLASTCPDAEVIATVNCDWDYATAKAAVEDLLSTYSEIDGVLSQGGAMTQAAIDAFNSAGRELVPMTGEGSNGFLRSWVENKDKGFSSLAFICPCSQSAAALDVAVTALNGVDVDKEYLMSVEPVTDENLMEYYREDLNDNYWVASGLDDATLIEMFGEDAE